MSKPLLNLYYASAINRLKMSLRGARQCEAVLALRPSGKSLSSELWILLASLQPGVWLRLRLRLDAGGVGSGLTTQDNKA